MGNGLIARQVQSAGQVLRRVYGFFFHYKILTRPASSSGKRNVRTVSPVQWNSLSRKVTQVPCHCSPLFRCCYFRSLIVSTLCRASGGALT
jgi:hypothetical protein